MKNQLFLSSFPAFLIWTSTNVIAVEEPNEEDPILELKLPLVQ